MICLPGNVHKHIGYFDDEETAARAYDREALQHGLQERMNFPLEGAAASLPKGSSQYRGVWCDKQSGKCLTPPT